MVSQDRRESVSAADTELLGVESYRQPIRAPVNVVRSTAAKPQADIEAVLATAYCLLPTAYCLLPMLPIEVDCRTVNADRTAGADFLLLDCREPDEYAVVKIEGAKLLPMSEIAARVEELAPDRQRRIVVHCHHGGRSLRVANWLREQGFEQAQSMAGGIDAWAVEIDPSLARY
jgi:rhodanese-related sulfurtransferase